jgi:hypothetical protein
MITRITATLLIFSLSWLFAAPSQFILHNDEVVLQKAADKMEEMMGELHQKTQIAVYLSAIAKLPEGESITTYGQKLSSDLQSPFVLISVSRIDQQIDVVSSPDMADRFDEDELLGDYIIPFFVEYRRDVTPQQQMSAGLLNGVAHLSDHFAEQEDVILLSSIGAESENFITGLMLVIKIMLGLTAVAMFIAWYRSRKGASA